MIYLRQIPILKVGSRNVFPVRRVAHSVLSDSITGLNVRESDNRLQGFVVVVSVLVAAAIGAVLAAMNAQWELPWYSGAVMGGFAGSFIGIIASGIYLMIYRAIRNIQGNHDETV